MNSIPTYGSDKTNRSEVIVNRLSQLNEYDFTEPHRHHYFEFFYFKKGGGNHIIDFQKFEIHSNSVHIVAPGQVHQVNRELSSEGFVYLFELVGLQAPKIINDFFFEHECFNAAEKAPFYVFNSNKSEEVESKVKKIWNAYEAKETLWELEVRNAIQSICIDCMQQGSGVLDTGNRNDYLNFRKLLHGKFRELKKVKEYAEVLNVSEKSLNDLVKQHTGQSTSALIYGQLIMEAKRLLKTNISIKETAYDLNFDDPAHFSKFFKSNTGYSPSDFQNNT